MGRRSKSRRPTYVLGTGISHDGSACLLKDGQVAVAIEKERITRVKHDGGNDTAAVRYCLETEGIAIEDLALIVQNGIFGDFSRGNSYFGGPRLIRDDLPVPVVTISHHLAHAYSAIGMCPFPEAALLVIDGCGNTLEECTDLQGLAPPFTVDDDTRHLYFEKDSYYLWREGRLQTVFKDFSPWTNLYVKTCPMMLNNVAKHSIGGVYAVASHYCVRGTADLGKLMGLAPYGRDGIYKERIFELRDGRVFANPDWMRGFDRPARTANDFKRDFQYYADIAYWVQREVERALLYLIQARYEMCPASNLAYAGGVALNAVANARILQESKFRRIYMVPAAGDNGIALGCAFYGWLEALGRERVLSSGSTCFGRGYRSQDVMFALRSADEMAVPPPESGTADPAEQIEGLLWSLQKGLEPSVASTWSTKLRWEVAGVATFATEIRDGRLRVWRDGVEPVTAVIRGDAVTIAHIFRGRLHPARAVEHGRLQCTNLDALLYFHAGINWKAVAPEQSASLPLAGFSWRHDSDPVGCAAQLLADGKVIAWFQGGSEFGPRALGHRSILADPRKPGVVDLINVRVKRREEFRPFAPSVLLEDASTYFECDFESPYMILVAQVREQWRETLRSVTHLDGSARLQTVTPDWNPRYYDLLKIFKRLTGLPVLLNTSFNRKGMPIVETPEEAINFFREADGLDALLIEDFVLEPKEASDLWHPDASSRSRTYAANGSST
jgi:predicted NodU family carbamoyl transferase